jgi:glycosyltransferase involved in cell wall biosynthesis
VNTHLLEYYVEGQAALPKSIFLVSRCAWTLYNFRAGLMRLLKSQGVTVIGGGAAGDGFEPKVEALGVPFIPLPVDKKGIHPRADVALLRALYHWYHHEKPDIVHHFTIKPVIYGSIAARLAGVPRIVNTVTGLGYVFMAHRSWLRHLAEWQYRVALACAHVTFFQNRDDLELFHMRRLVKPQKTVLVPGSGVDCSLFTPTCADTLTSPAKPLTFLMVARLLRDKGIYEFVQAASMVQRDFPYVQFQLLGGRDERNPTVVSQAELDQWQTAGLVTWLGEVADVRPIIAQADVVVLPSYREGTPRALLEAAAMGKPLITTDTVGCREVVEEGVNGLLVPVKDATALAQAMVRLLNDSAMRERMGQAGREKMEREFDEQIVLDKILKTYEGLL